MGSAAGANHHLRPPSLEWMQSSHSSGNQESPALAPAVQLTKPEQAQALLTAAKAAVSMQLWPLQGHVLKQPSVIPSVQSMQFEEGPGRAHALASVQNLQSKHHGMNRTVPAIAASKRYNWSRLGQGRADAANALVAMQHLQPERGQGRAKADTAAAILLPQRHALEQKMHAVASSQLQTQPEQGQVAEHMTEAAAHGESLQPCMSSQMALAAESPPQGEQRDDGQVKVHAPMAAPPAQHLQRMKKRRVCVSRLVKCETPRRWWQLFTG